MLSGATQLCIVQKLPSPFTHFYPLLPHKLILNATILVKLNTVALITEGILKQNRFGLHRKFLLFIVCVFM